jgi:citrate synthase
VAVARGLEDIVAGRSAITFLDGRKGKLLYRGYDIADLAEHATFEEVAFLLWQGMLPKRGELEELNRQLVASRGLPPALVQLLQGLPSNAAPMDALRTAVSALSHFDPASGDESAEANLLRAVRLTAQVASIVAVRHRARTQLGVVPPTEEPGHATNFLYMLHGRHPEARAARILDVCLILHADHEFNASTFAGRTTASTLSDIYSAITSAVGTLKGRLHGGANVEVIRMFDQIQDPDRAAAHARAVLAGKGRVPGFGHRVYKSEDPRATVLRRLAHELSERVGESRWVEMGHQIEEVMLRERNLRPNVDFYSGVVYRLLDIPSDLFTAMFALARVAGWTAHVLEQYADNRLIRPVAEYTGPAERRYVPLEAR